MVEVCNLLENITDSMTIITRVIGLMAGYFLFSREFVEFFYFLEYPPRFYVASCEVLKKNLQLVIVR